MKFRCFEDAKRYAIKQFVVDLKDSVKLDYELEGILQDCMNWDLGGHYNKSFVKDNLERKYKISLKGDIRK